MIKTYDEPTAAWVETPPKIYDAATASRIDAPSAKTYDTATAAWVEHLYQGYFTLRQDGSTPTLSAADELTISANSVVLFTAKTAEGRRVVFDFPIKWAGESVEFNLVSNGIARVSLSRHYSYGSAGSVSGAYQTISEVYEGTVTIPLGTCPDEEDGQPVTSSKIFFEIIVGADKAGNDTGYVKISNLKINGKKYGFTE